MATDGNSASVASSFGGPRAHAGRQGRVHPIKAKQLGLRFARTRRARGRAWQQAACEHREVGWGVDASHRGACSILIAGKTAAQGCRRRTGGQ